MATDTLPPPLPRVIDLTGLPEPVVEYVHQVVRHARTSQGGDGTSSAAPTPVFDIPPPKLTLEEWRQALDEMAAMGSGQSLPADWSRADLYEDHD